MHADKLAVTVRPDHRLAIDLPDDFPQGPAEVIVLAQVRTAVDPPRGSSPSSLRCRLVRQERDSASTS
jgi:hypothetical protein